MEVFQVDWNSYWTGRSLTLPPKSGVPSGYTRHTIPALAEGEYAVLARNGWAVTDIPPPPRPLPPPVPNPLGFRMALITDPDLLPIYSAVNHAAMSSIGVSHSFILFNESLWNEPFLIEACQVALNTLDAVYDFSVEEKQTLSEAFARFALDLDFT